MRELIDECRTKGTEKPTFVLDNAPHAHNAHNRAQDVVCADEDVQILRLAPYSYLLSPIEFAWSAFKAAVKRKLQEAMPEIVNFIRQSNSPTIAEFRMHILERIATEAK